jgi:hypothetical protein
MTRLTNFFLMVLFAVLGILVGAILTPFMPTLTLFYALSTLFMPWWGGPFRPLAPSGRRAGYRESTIILLLPLFDYYLAVICRAGCRPRTGSASGPPLRPEGEYGPTKRLYWSNSVEGWSKSGQTWSDSCQTLSKAGQTLVKRGQTLVKLCRRLVKRWSNGGLEARADLLRRLRGQAPAKAPGKAGAAAPAKALVKNRQIACQTAASERRPSFCVENVSNGGHTAVTRRSAAVKGGSTGVSPTILHELFQREHPDELLSKQKTKNSW